MTAQTSPTSLPPPPPPPTPPLRPFNITKSRGKLSAKGARLTASTLLLLAAILLAVSMGLSWWGASASGGGRATVIGFLPGAHYVLQVGSNSTSPTYISAGLVHVGNLYEAVLGLGVTAALVGLAAMILGYAGAFGGFNSRKFLSVTLLLSLVSFVGAVLPVALVAAGQPGAFNADSTSGFGGSGCGSSPNPCTSFWNSVTTMGVTVSWGADVGWYLGVAATALLFVALYFLWTTRKSPYTRDELNATRSNWIPT